MEDQFLDDFASGTIDNGKDAILRLLASCVLGDNQYDILRLRYEDMARNYDCVTADGKLKRRYINDDSVKVWEFSEGVKPHRRENTQGEYYSDTCSVKIPITHPFFSQLRKKVISENNYKGAVIGLDLPTWFNLISDKRVMIVAQDPLRDPTWYHECEEAICSSPFGLHGREWRENGRGGRRIALLVEKLIDSGYGVYLTDAYKFFVRGWTFNEKKADILPLTKDSTAISLYREMLIQEIEIIRPNVIVTLGKAAGKALDSILGERGYRILHMTHFSGSAQGTLLASSKYADIKKALGLNDDSVETQASVYAYAIEHSIEI
ncbi:uracil-DNA glycosylase family protein [Bacteroides acidifaciens]|uniref:uracil-DNA glycosylase family protein n=1 Tax=Bacteroides acidifaciens TaxID=85831 RepID=UPI0026203BA5|nr:uracil-DNA glycosylase family protein [Bacteroides acidifaciens]